MILEIVLFLILIISLKIAHYYYKKHKITRFRFVGPRGTGKTQSLINIMQYPHGTVPSRERYEVREKNLIIEDVPAQKGDFDFYEMYGVDKDNWDYFFFIKDPADIKKYPTFLPRNFRYVLYRKLKDDEKKLRSIVYLEENPKILLKYV